MSIHNRKKRIHFVGIGGIGMSGIAEILLELGHRVSGSDQQLSALTDYLEQKGAVIYNGHSAENLKEVDLVVYTSAVKKDNPEISEAKRRGIPLIRRAEMLGQLMSMKFGIAVAGTHGKTTTTSMAGHVLIEAGLDPTVVVGGRLKNLHTNARLGQGKYMVTEADEYDRSFLALYPRIAIITNLEADHLDIYSDINDLEKTFLRFANQVPFDGSVIACDDDIRLKKLIPEMTATVITYGIDKDANVRAVNIQYNEDSAVFDVIYDDKTLGPVKIYLPGEHNVKNSLAVIAMALEMEIPFPKLQKALEKFAGVDRRFEIKKVVNDIMFVDDYAHHPSEIKATISGARNGWRRRIVAVFQPHLYSRTRDFYAEFADSLKDADVVVITGIYPAREEPISGIDAGMISDELLKTGHNDVHYIRNKADVPAFLKSIIKTGDMVITMGAGDIWVYGEKAINEMSV
ncbi:MAG: UDP-N-acetylmuramate--L-alanine ligase [Calditrichaceae bacterium]